MINKLPKIELHCHLDGSVRVDTIIDIAKRRIFIFLFLLFFSILILIK
ncbi:hypothetical protein [Clostridium sp.]|nr:hypothetical protein [Clostridium sp.]